MTDADVAVIVLAIVAGGLLGMIAARAFGMLP